MQNTYSSKANATRAAKKTGMEFEILPTEGGRFTYQITEKNACNEAAPVVSNPDTTNTQNGVTKMDEQTINPIDAAKQNETDTKAAYDAAREQAKAAAAALKSAKQDLANGTKALQTMDKDADDYAAGQAWVEGEGAQAVATAQQAADDAKSQVDAAKAEFDAAKENTKATRAAVREAKKEAAAAAKAEREAAKANRVEQNGQREPTPGTTSATLWAIYDDVANAKGGAPAITEVLQPGLDAGIVEGTVRAAYAHWRKFHGITGRVLSAEAVAAKEAAEAAKAEKAEKAAAEKAAKAQAKADAKAAKEAEKETA